MLGHLKFALHNIFLLVVAAGALTLLINLFSWALGLPGHGYQDYAGAGYQGYQAPGSGYPGYPGYMSGEKSYPAPGPHQLLSLLSPEALTELVERIKTGGGLGGVSRMGAGGSCQLGPNQFLC